MVGWDFFLWDLLVQGVLYRFSVFFWMKCNRKKKKINDWILDLENIWKFKIFFFLRFCGQYNSFPKLVLTVFLFYVVAINFFLSSVCF